MPGLISGRAGSRPEMQKPAKNRTEHGIHQNYVNSNGRPKTDRDFNGIRSNRCVRTNDTLDAKIDIVRHQTANVRTERMSNARRSLHWHSGVAQKRKALRQAFRNRLEIMNGRNVARCATQIPPVDHKNIVRAMVYVRLSASNERNGVNA